MTDQQGGLRRLVFRLRSYTPLPFLMVMAWFAAPTLASLLAGFAIVVLGESLRFWGVSIVGSETRTTGRVGGTFLITNGPFAYTRNPLYLGNMLMYAGVGVMSMAFFPWLIIVALAWFYLQYFLIVTQEEEYLAGRFGAEYDEYCMHVRRFFPRWSPYRSSSPPPKRVNPAEGFASERRTLQAIGAVTMVIVGIYVYQQLRS